MMDASIFTDEENAWAVDHPALGAAYKRTQDIAERFMADFREEQFKPLIDAFASQFAEKLWDDLKVSLLSDTECNLQTDMRYVVDATVRAILTGEQWALKQYPLSQYHDGRAIRAAIFEQHRDVLTNARIADLEAENAVLKKQLEWARR